MQYVTRLLTQESAFYL